MKKIINKDNYRKLLNIDLFLIILLLFTLTSLISYSYYNNRYSFKYLNTVVGNFFSKDSDVSLLINIENGTRNGKKTYKIVSSIPDNGYTYKSSNCKNGSSITYDEETSKISITSSVKDECYAYFDLTRESDLTMNILIEKLPNTNEFVSSSVIPIYGYYYSHSNCKNGSNITYIEDTNKLYLTTSTIDSCDIYFNKLSSNIDANVYLNNSGVLELLQELDDSKVYKINSNSICRLNRVKVESNITITNNKININSSDNSKCDVILDIVN